jgi:restriction endonuclease S subunit
MGGFEISAGLNTDKAFLVNFAELQGRLDPLFYNTVHGFSLVKTTYPVKKLSEVINMQRGRFGHRPRNDPKFYDGQYPFIQTGDVVKASQTDSPIAYTQTLNEIGLKTSRLFDKDVMVVTIAANIGDTAILDYPACFPDSLIGITPKTTELTLSYLNIYFKFLKPYLEDIAPQSAQKNINYQQLSPVPIVVPPLALQKQITDLFKKAHKQKQQKEQQAQALLNSIDIYLLNELGITLPEQDSSLEKRMFTVPFREVTNGRLDPFYNDLYYKEVLIKIKHGIFQNVFLKDLCYSVSGVIYSRDDEAKSGMAILRANNINLKDTELNFNSVRYLRSSLELDSSQKLYKNDIFMCAASGSKEHVGKVSFIESDLDLYFGGFMMVLRQASINHNQRYLFEYLQSNIFRKILSRLLGGTNINNINFNMLAFLPVSLPPIKKQNEIVTHITHIRTQAKQLQTEAAQILTKAKEEIERMILGEV